MSTQAKYYLQEEPVENRQKIVNQADFYISKSNGDVLLLLATTGPESYALLRKIFSVFEVRDYTGLITSSDPEDVISGLRHRSLQAIAKSSKER